MTINKVFRVLFFLSAFSCVCLAEISKIQDIDFRNFNYPWDAPESNQPSEWYWTQIPTKSHVRLHDAEHRFIDRTAPNLSPTLRLVSLKYGDLDGDGTEEASITLNYTTGGTMNWEYLYVYKIFQGKPKLLGRLRSGSRAFGGLNSASIQNGLLVLDFADSDKRTGDCCSTGYIRVRYRWSNGKFVEEGPWEKGDSKP